MFQKLAFSVEGVAWLLMHNSRLCNPLDPVVVKIREYTAKRKKTDADWKEIFHLEFLGGLYVDERGQPCVPGEVLEGCIIKGATKQRLGTAFKPAMFVEGNWPLKYDGPRDPEAMWKSGKFHDVRTVVVQRARVQRCRPLFRQWALDFEVTFNPSLINPKQIVDVVNIAGMQCGLGDYIPKFGRFLVTSHELLEDKQAA